MSAGEPRVLIFAPQYPPAVGGAERQAEKLALTLAERGVDTTVLTPAYGRTRASCSSDRGVSLERFPLIDLQRVPLVRQVRGYGVINAAMLRWQVRRAVVTRVASADVMYCSIAGPLTAFAAAAAAVARRPVVCKIAMAGVENDLAKIARNPRYGQSMVDRLISDVAAWIATTDAVRESLVEVGVPQQRIVSIPNGVVIQQRPDRRKYAGPLRLLHVGRLSSAIQRDVPGVIAAFNEIARQSPDAQLVIVGGGDQLNSMAALAARLPAADRIRLTGQQDPAEWFQWANAYIQPSRREGLSNALLEAMAAGLACVATSIPPNREVLDGGAAGDLVPLGDHSALVDVLRRLLRPEYRAERGESAAERAAKRYSIAAVADQHIALYKHLIAAARGAVPTPL